MSRPRQYGREIEEEHANAGDQNRWIRVGKTSVQSRHIATIRVEEPPQERVRVSGESPMDKQF
jgi:hypothetical protein